MKRTWTPALWGRLLTFSTEWSISIDKSTLTVLLGRKKHCSDLAQVRGVSQKQGLAWASICVEFQSGNVNLDGIANDAAVELERIVNEEIERSLSHKLQELSAPIETWARLVRRAWPDDRWISQDEVRESLARAARHTDIGAELAKLLQHPRLRGVFKLLPSSVHEAIQLYLGGVDVEVARRNSAFLERELVQCEPLFEKIENKPLTPEQARAVVCFENRLLLIAAAGSGKTSTLIAKAGYALSRKLVPADEILMLAFNAEAAKELRGRIRERLGSITSDPDAVTARTFHAFGLSIIGQATGRKPDLAPWLEIDNGTAEVEAIIKHLCSRSLKFKAMWQLYKFVLSDDVRKFGSREEPEDWDRETGAKGFLTRNGEYVKSREERTIADWLHFNGVRYIYEGEYEHDTADVTHGRYHPDFFYPEAGLYHEHFALNEEGKAPAHFLGYLDSVRWKRALHAEKGTALIETTSAQLRDGSAFDSLAEQLISRGIQLNPQEDRPISGRPIPPDRELVRPFRTFQVHAKSNRLSIDELRQRRNELPTLGLQVRHKIFLDIYEQVSEEWDRRLAAGGYVDFEDMLNQATEHMEAGRWTSPYKLVLADEFQDASRARAKFLQSLVREPGRFFCAVGDDWQSINRFAGADIGVMTEFEALFGKGETRFLSTSFRCPKALCDLSSAFVSRNPAQIRKSVEAAHDRPTVGSVCYSVNDAYAIEPLLGKHLQLLFERLKDGTVEAGRAGSVSVFILGRYRRNRPSSLDRWRAQYSPRLMIDYYTIHGSKGLEADYVCIVGLTRGRYGFPSEVEDDSIFPLAMPTVEEYPFAEERRLFYVALTRARRLVMLYTVENQISEFVVELQSAPYNVEVKRSETAEPFFACPACGRGMLVRRHGRYGAFWGCTRFPACDHTSKESTAAPPQRGNRRGSEGGPR